MNHKQKLGYIVLSAVIMLIGIGVGSIVCPPLIAERNSVFDEIQCSKLTVVNEMGKAAIRLAALKTSNSVMVHDSDERKASIAISDDNGKYAVHLAAGETRNRVIVYDANGKPAIGLYADEFGNNVSVYDKALKVIRDGLAKVPERPGLGVALDMDAVERYRVG